MKRREVLSLVGGAMAAWPFSAYGQQAKPVIGFVNSASPQGYSQQLAAFLKGLGEAGYVDGRNVAIEYRWAEGKLDRLPALVADLVQRQVSVIAATTRAAAHAAKVATTTIPIVFETGVDPIQAGLVTGLSRPGGNITGVTQANVELAPKRLQILHEALPAVHVMALLVNPADPVVSGITARQMQAAARVLGVELHVLNATSEHDFDPAFASVTQLGVGGLVIGGGGFLASHLARLAALTVRHAVPAISQHREFTAAGGLMSYGSDIEDAYRLAGVYTGRILKGDKPADLPVQQATKVEFTINMKTAKSLGVNVPLPLLGRADKVIE